MVIKKRILIFFIASLLFGMLSCNVAAISRSPFIDVAVSDSFFNEILYTYENNLMFGMGNKKFYPNKEATRSMLVSVLYNMEGKPKTNYYPFADVSADKWYTDAVSWAVTNNIVNGYSDTNFHPDDSITREQIVTILYRYAKYKQYDLTTTGNVLDFTDGHQTATYALVPMNWAIGKGLIFEISNNRIKPTENTTRSYLAAITKLFCNNVSEKSTKKTLFSIDAKKITSITVNDGNLGETKIMNPDQIRHIVSLINGFKYASSEKIPPSTGSGYTIILKTKITELRFEFWADGIRMEDQNGEPGASIMYYGDTGYFDSLIALADQIV